MANARLAQSSNKSAASLPKFKTRIQGNDIHPFAGLPFSPLYVTKAPFEQCCTFHSFLNLWEFPIDPFQTQIRQVFVPSLIDRMPHSRSLRVFRLAGSPSQDGKKHVLQNAELAAEER